MWKFDCQVTTWKTALIGREDDKDHYATENPPLTPVFFSFSQLLLDRNVPQMKLDVLQLSDGKKTMKHDLHKPMFWRCSDRRDERKKS